MARLIDADAFLKDILTAGIGKTIIEYSESDIGYMIRKRPTVDAVEVVRCKDCTYKRITKGSMEVKSYSCNCTWSPCRGRIVEPSFFCFYGERKTE